MLHRLEQVSSAESVGSLAENLIEALRENHDVAKKVSCFHDLRIAFKVFLWFLVELVASDLQKSFNYVYIFDHDLL